MPDPLFERLFRETTTMNWQPVDEIRRRGQRRAALQRTALLASAFVAVALIAVGATVYGLRPTAAPIPAGTPTPTSVPTQGPPTQQPPRTSDPGPSRTGPVVTQIPTSALLQPADANNGTPNDQPHCCSDGTLRMSLAYCRNGIPDLNLTPTAARTRTFEYGDSRYLSEIAQVYQPGDAARLFAWYKNGVAAPCPGVQVDAASLSVVAQSFAGTESILVQATAGLIAKRTLYVLVRVGDVLIEISADPADDAYSKQLGVKAAQRICQLARTC